MMKQNSCGEYWDLLNDYVDGRLHGRDQDDVEQHLAGCPACREVVVEIRFLQRSLVAEDTPVASQEFWSNSIKRAESIHVRRRSWSGLAWKPAFGLAAAALAASLTLWLMPNQVSAPPVIPEVPVCDFLMEHTGVMVGHPLSVSSHHVLLNSKCAEDRAKAVGAEENME